LQSVRELLWFSCELLLVERLLVEGRDSSGSQRKGYVHCSSEDVTADTIAAMWKGLYNGIN
jgi:hypothetical protein